MRCKGIKDIDFQNYKKISMFIGTSVCDWKCCKEQNISVEICQNHNCINGKTFIVSNDELCKRYINNKMSEAIVIGGLEPFLQFEEVISFISKLRESSMDDIVIYTGYYPNEIEKELNQLKEYPNIIVKFGRYIINSISRYDEILGVHLVSDNQYAKKIS